MLICCTNVLNAFFSDEDAAFCEEVVPLTGELFSGDDSEALVAKEDMAVMDHKLMIPY